MFSSALERSRRRSGKADENGGRLTPPTSRREVAPGFFCRGFSSFCYCSIPNVSRVFHLIHQVFWMFPNHKNIFGHFYDCVQPCRYATVFSVVSKCVVSLMFSMFCPTDWSLFRWWICRWIPFRYPFVSFESWMEMLSTTFSRILPCSPAYVLRRHIQTWIVYIHLLPSIDNTFYHNAVHIREDNCTVLLLHLSVPFLPALAIPGTALCVSLSFLSCIACEVPSALLHIPFRWNSFCTPSFSAHRILRPNRICRKTFQMLSLFFVLLSLCADADCNVGNVTVRLMTANRIRRTVCTIFLHSISSLHTVGLLHFFRFFCKFNYRLLFLGFLC